MNTTDINDIEGYHHTIDHDVQACVEKTQGDKSTYDVTFSRLCGDGEYVQFAYHSGLCVDELLSALAQYGIKL